MPEIIKQAAIFKNGVIYTMPRPNRHHNIIHNFKHLVKRGEQGFITSSDRFVSREEAMKIAMEANQLIKEPYNSDLFSENVW